MLFLAVFSAWAGAAVFSAILINFFSEKWMVLEGVIVNKRFRPSGLDERGVQEFESTPTIDVNLVFEGRLIGVSFSNSAHLEEGSRVMVRVHPVFPRLFNCLEEDYLLWSRVKPFRRAIEFLGYFVAFFSLITLSGSLVYLAFSDFL